MTYRFYTHFLISIRYNTYKWPCHLEKSPHPCCPFYKSSFINRFLTICLSVLIFFKIFVNQYLVFIPRFLLDMSLVKGYSFRIILYSYNDILDNIDLKVSYFITTLVDHTATSSTADFRYFWLLVVAVARSWGKFNHLFSSVDSKDI